MATRNSIDSLVADAKNEYKKNGYSDIVKQIEDKVLNSGSNKWCYFFLKECPFVDKEKYLMTMLNSESRDYWYTEIIEEAQSEEILKAIYSQFMKERKKASLSFKGLSYHISNNAYELAEKYKNADVNKLFDLVVMNHIVNKMPLFLKLDNIDAKNVVKKFFKYADLDDFDTGKYFADLYHNYKKHDNDIKSTGLQHAILDKITGTSYILYENFIETLKFDEIDAKYVIKKAIEVGTADSLYKPFPTLIRSAKKYNQEDKIKDINFNDLLKKAVEKCPLGTITNIATWVVPYVDTTPIENCVLQKGDLSDVQSYLWWNSNNMKNYPAFEKRLLKEANEKNMYTILETFFKREVLNNNVDFNSISKKVLEYPNVRNSIYFSSHNFTDFGKHFAVIRRLGGSYEYEIMDRLNKRRLQEIKNNNISKNNCLINEIIK